MPLHIKFSGGYHLGERVTLVEDSCFLDFGSEIRGHRGSRLIVPCIVVEDGGIKRPMLVELRRELHEIARHCGIGECGVHGIGEHAMQCVAELVEHRGHVSEADERRLPRRGFREVGDIEYDRQRAEKL